MSDYRIIEKEIIDLNNILYKVMLKQQEIMAMCKDLPPSPEKERIDNIITNVTRKFYGTTEKPQPVKLPEPKKHWWQKL